MVYTVYTIYHIYMLSGVYVYYMVGALAMLHSVVNMLRKDVIL